MNMYLPIIIVVLSNTVYHICAKSTPDNVNTFASLSVTYAVGALVSILLYFATKGFENAGNDYRQLNWTSFALGVAIVGLEAGFLLMYKSGWDISTGQLVSSAVLAVVLIFVGYLLYKEAVTVQKIAGIAVCLLGLYLINK